MKPEIIDNFLEPEEFSGIRNLILGHQFPWFFIDFIDYKQDNQNDLTDFQFTHAFYDYCVPTSNFYSNVLPLINKICPLALVRVKANLLTFTGKQRVNSFHTDIGEKFNGKTAVYYLNTNDGKTIFSNGKEIESVENRLVIFDGTCKHKGTSCSDKKGRYLINLNYYI